MFKDANAIELKEDFKNRFRNVSRLMDCVGCDKCRLWGKVQTQGYGTALKVLFEFDEDKGVGENPPLRRTELVALVNTLDKLSTSLNAVSKFQQMWEARQLQEKQQAEEGKGGEVQDNASPEDTESEDHHDHEHMSIIEIFWEELEVVWEAMRFIVGSWFALPGHMLVYPWDPVFDLHNNLTSSALFSWEIVKHEVKHLYNIYFLKHDVTKRKLKWYETKPVDVRAIKEDRKKRKLRERDEL